MFYAKLSYAQLCCSVIFCIIIVSLSLSLSLSIYIYIWLSSSSERRRSIDDQVLDLALMTNYSQSTFMWTVASSFSLFA